MAPKPDVLLLDEPLSALDYKLRRGMQIELKRLQLETGITFIFVTHDQEEALTMSDRIAVMSDGHILQVGTPNEIYSNPQERFVADFIGESNFITADIISVSKGKDAKASLRLCGSRKELKATLPANKVKDKSATVFIRPEHARLQVSSRTATMIGTLTNILFFGTDTNFHLRLENGDSFVVRSQNEIGRNFNPSIGDALGIVIDEQAIQILKD